MRDDAPGAAKFEPEGKRVAPAVPPVSESSSTASAGGDPEEARSALEGGSPASRCVSPGVQTLCLAQLALVAIDNNNRTRAKPPSRAGAKAGRARGPSPSTRRRRSCSAVSESRKPQVLAATFFFGDFPPPARALLAGPQRLSSPGTRPRHASSSAHAPPSGSATYPSPEQCSRKKRVHRAHSRRFPVLDRMAEGDFAAWTQ